MPYSSVSQLSVRAQVAAAVGGAEGAVEGTWTGAVWGVTQRSDSSATPLTAPLFTFSAAADDDSDAAAVQVAPSPARCLHIDEAGLPVGRPRRDSRPPRGGGG